MSVIQGGGPGQAPGPPSPGVQPGTTPGEREAVSSKLQVQMRATSELKPSSRNARTHRKRQIQQIADSIRRFGFVSPILITPEREIIAGHGRWEAALLLGIPQVPTICLSHLNEAEMIALMIIDNRLTENSEWNERLLGEHFKFLAGLNLDFPLQITGFETPEIDLFIEGLTVGVEGSDRAEQVPAVSIGPPVSKPGDIWLLGDHRVRCGDARQLEELQQLMGSEVAGMAFTDPPFNVPIDGHASGKGAVKHADFLMASGEMSRDEFTAFLTAAFRAVAKHMRDGAIAFICMDWRHIGEILVAGEKTFRELKNVCVWAKDRAGMGSFYRSQHELIFVFKNGTASHTNNIQLGQFGRHRTNIWHYPAAASFGRTNEEGNLLAMHPTVKPVAMVADAIMDCSNGGDIILDSFLGSGTTLIAAERTRRVCYGLELDPAYVDVLVRRWQRYTGACAVHAQSKRRFSDLEDGSGNVD